MDASQLWSLFLETGAPEVYLAYKHAVREQTPISA